MVTPCTSMRAPGSSWAITSICPPIEADFERAHGFDVDDARLAGVDDPLLEGHCFSSRFGPGWFHVHDISRLVENNTIYREFRIIQKNLSLTLTRRQRLPWRSRPQHSREEGPWTSRSGPSSRSRSSREPPVARCVTTTTSDCCAPSSIGSNGYRHYDKAALVRLQRILLLRDLGLGLPQIAGVLEREGSEAHALEGHLAWLRQEQDRADASDRVSGVNDQRIERR